MRALMRMAALLAAGGLCVLILGRLAMPDAPLTERRAAALSVQAWPMTLSDENLVDAIAALSFHHRLARVSWDHSMLGADILLRGGGDAAGGLADDLVALISFSFEDTANVRQVLIRVYRPAGGRKELLFYGDPRREDWNVSRKAAFKAAAENGDWRGLMEACGLKGTPAGERWLQHVAKS